MNIPDTIVAEIKAYLHKQADRGDLEAQTLLAQLEQVDNFSQETATREMLSPPPEKALGC
ncbi:hypothetical protein [Oscillatoria salina]|uniref:hypothetical protein n=1 Tax=Oscillatoria salina TaxID=331517 RepID=UPI0013B6B47E|nr:hypothetical protein [Oscillatoria salina]MBZ8181404.1 hypothetical protein [Oscillatoria salina IIICB1]NET88710.1 hypothetical protein [Kamptonema sp. SIO1D9]